MHIFIAHSSVHSALVEIVYRHPGHATTSNSYNYKCNFTKDCGTKLAQLLKFHTHFPLTSSGKLHITPKKFVQSPL